VAGLAVLVLLLLGCGSDDGGSGSTKNAPLFEFNASQNDGRTVRWANLPIRVFLGNGVAGAGEVTAWTQATGGAVTFTFVGGAGAANITFDRGVTNPDTCGVTSVVWDDSGPIVEAHVSVNAAIYRSPNCVRTVTHETAHAIGFLDHSNDGGLMDPDGGNGAITPVVGGMLRDLYLLPPGTAVIAQTRRLPLGNGARRVVTFTYPVRR
jgi:hypothetical protein